MPSCYSGPEDRNGKRNHDEIRFWADYIGGRVDPSYIYDDAGLHGGIRGEYFVIVGDMNADPFGTFTGPAKRNLVKLAYSC